MKQVEEKRQKVLYTHEIELIKNPARILCTESGESTESTVEPPLQSNGRYMQTRGTISLSVYKVNSKSARKLCASVADSSMGLYARVSLVDSLC